MGITYDLTYDFTYDIFYIAILMNAFIFYDHQLRRDGFMNPYYAVHAVHNAMIVYLTMGDVLHTFMDFSYLTFYPMNVDAVKWCIALHFYHILMYWRSFRYDDWLHHVLMIGIAIPIGTMLSSHLLMGLSLFFTTGLPGGIDYALLFAVRNGWIESMKEKQINTFLNVWIRSPGCIAHATLTVIFALQKKSYLALIPAFLTFWNGQYFMEKVVSDYSARRVSDK